MTARLQANRKNYDFKIDVAMETEQIMELNIGNRPGKEKKMTSWIQYFSVNF